MSRFIRSGDPGLVRWQASKARRVKPRMGLGAILAAITAILGLLTVAAQGLGWLHLPGWLAFVPVGVVLAALSAQLVAAARYALEWLGG